MIFSEIGLNINIQKAIKDLGFIEPTPIQKEAIPYLINGDEDLIALAQTGTGKTAAFGLPIIEKIETDRKLPQTIILCPTRELCLQVSNVFKPFSHNLKFSMYNMQQDHIEKQRVKRLDRGVNVLISTPGRLKQHLDSNTLHLSKLEFVVIDEADTTINDFRDVRNILRSLLSRRIVDGPKKPKKKRPDCQFFLTSANSLKTTMISVMSTSVFGRLKSLAAASYISSNDALKTSSNRLSIWSRSLYSDFLNCSENCF